jgi:dephospho-CoA kinase
MRVVGLTGGIATGKSTVARLLREEHGVPVLDADVVAREVVAPGSDVLAALVGDFGPDILNDAGGLDRAAMRRRIATDPDARARLEARTHPAIRERVASWIAEQAGAGAPIAVVEAALLVETGGHQAYPELWVVSTTPERQWARLKDRDGGDDDVLARLVAAQLPLAVKERHATRVIRNDDDVDALRAEVAAALGSRDTAR